jgi:hypothetical protein
MTLPTLLARMKPLLIQLGNFHNADASFVYEIEGELWRLWKKLEEKRLTNWETLGKILL